jgi:eukaryotic-like serine/threonine-protein kinase
MSITGQFVLPEDVLVFPVSELAPEMRTRVTSGPEDFVVTRPNARHPSKVVAPDAAALIQGFRTATTIVDAVIAFTSGRDLDPHKVLEEAFPFVQQLLAAGILVPAASVHAERISPSLEPGAPFAGWTVERGVHLVEDTEVYRLNDTTGRAAALKLARAGHEANLQPVLQHEAALLRRLDGTAAPRLLGSGEEGGRPYLLLEWCEGVPAPALAGRLRAVVSHDGSRRLLALCLSVLHAYAGLHARSVIHGDVHPNNVLATEDGGVRILDFGIARLLGDAGPLGSPPRGGVQFYFDPMAAEAMAAGRVPPPADAASEQYALGALLRELLVGRAYLDFSVERERMLRQIVEERPVPFVRHGMRPWLEVERIIGQALAKDPERRFASVTDFADALAQAGSASASTGAAGGTPPAILSAVLERVGRDGPAYAALGGTDPLSSVNTGAAGIAYALYRIASVREDPAPLALAELWIAAVERNAGDEASFYSDELDLTPATVGRVSLFHTPAGVSCVEALIGIALGDEARVAGGVERFLARSHGPCDNLDLTLGRSSTLLGCAALLATLPQEAVGARSALIQFGDEVADGIRSAMAVLPAAGETQPLNLGIAHGWGGVLFALLRWREACNREGADEVVEARLRQLANCAEPTGEGLRWRWLTGQPGVDNFMPGWCNGSAGLVHLWNLAHRQFRREDYGMLARGAAVNAWQEPRNFGDLCCGAAGRAYAMLNLYRETGEGVWLERARGLAQDAAAGIANWSLRRDSLYKGEIGVALLIADLERPELSCMPLFDKEP